MNKVAHNLTVRSDYVQDQNQWMHHLSVVISDLDHNQEKIIKSEQFNMIVTPAMPPDVLVDALRALSDRVDHYVNTGDASGAMVKESSDEVG